MKLKKGLLSGIAGLATATALALTPAAAFAAGGPGGPGHGGGGGVGETTVTNNLSVPAVFVGSVGFGLPAPSANGELTALEPPLGAPSTGYETAGYYYVQGVNAWAAQYMVKTSETATAKWGDNLTGTAMKRVGHQIRVEVGLTSGTVTGSGYTVIKLNTSQADNVSPWGTLATGNTTSGFYATPTGGMAAKVWVANAYLTINGGSPIAMPGEINASGAVTFGYNWKPTAAGTYTLTFHVPTSVTISNGDTLTSTTLQVPVTSGGGGGHRGGVGGEG